MEEVDDNNVRGATRTDAIITKEALKWKRKKTANDFFLCSGVAPTDICKFDSFQRLFFIDTDDNMCMIIQCNDFYFPVPTVLQLKTKLEIFRGLQEHTKPFCIRPGLTIDQCSVYIARIPKVPQKTVIVRVPKAIQTVIGSQSFNTITEAKIYCRKLLSDRRDGAWFFKTSEMYEFCRALLQLHRHSDFSSLAASDINYFMIKSYNGQFYSYSFYVVLNDGRSFPFDYLHCLEKTTFSTDLKKAFRRYVQPQTLQFRKAALSNFSTCPLCNIKQDDTTNLHVDHISPQFSNLVDTFINGIDEEKRNEITIRGFGFDSACNDCLFGKLDVLGLWITPASIAQEWITYHKEHAILRLLCKSCNQTRKRKDCD